MDLLYKTSLAGKASHLMSCLLLSLLMAAMAEVVNTYAVPEGRYDSLVLAMCMIVLSTVGLFAGAFFVIILFYGWRTTEFTIRGGGQTAVRQSYYDFPLTRVTDERIFDRIIAIRIEQSAVDVFFGSGTLIISVVNFAGSDSAQSEIRIPQISFVESAKCAIMASQPHGDSGHERRITPQFA